jgi:uncharacterized protein
MLGFFCLGLVAGRRQLFQLFDEKKILFKKIFIWAGIAALILTLIAFVLVITNTAKNSFWSSYFGSLLKWQSNIMTVVYASGMSLFFYNTNRGWLAKQFGYIGKMALTNYILHSVLGTIILCGYGLGLLNYPISITMATISAIPLFMVMIMISRTWMHYYKYGPLEWIWRSLTYWKFQPIKNTAARH